MSEKKSTSGVPAVVEQIDALPAGIEGEIAGLEGLGYSERTEDSLIPILAILQDNSGEVKKNHSKNMKGAESGMLIMRSLRRLFSGEDGIYFQPCAFEHVWARWSGEPGEGAMVGRFPFDDMPAEAEQITDPQNPDKTMYVMPDNTRLVDTRYHYGHIVTADGAYPAVIPMSGTSHTSSRQWTAQMNQFRLPGGQKAPGWFRMYHITTRFNQRGSQSWYNYQVEDMGWIGDKKLRDEGRRLFEGIRDAELRAEDAVLTESVADEGDGSIPV